MSERPELCVGAVAIVDGHLLLIERGRGAAVGQWSIPGGRVERGETMTAAVERELLEETGVSAQCGPLIGWVERISTDHHFVIADFLVNPAIGMDEALRPGDDAANAKWFRVDELEGVDLVAGLLDFLREHALVP